MYRCSLKDRNPNKKKYGNNTNRALKHLFPRENHYESHDTHFCFGIKRENYIYKRNRGQLHLSLIKSIPIKIHHPLCIYIYIYHMYFMYL